MIGFADPWLLLLLLVPLAMRLLPSRADEEGAALRVPGAVASALVRAGGHRGPRLNRAVLPLAIWAALVLAIAGPRLPVASQALPVSGRDLVLVLDLSGSMVRTDFSIDGSQASRLDALKHAGRRFVLGRAGDRVALVVFATKAYFATPQTFDVEAVARALDDAEIGLSGRATGISEGLGLALKRLRRSEAASKVVILLSDGHNNAGPVKPRDAAALAADLGVRVHTIAMGPHARGEEGAGRDAVDAVTLAAIAEISGGETFRVRSTDDLLAVAAAIDALEPTVEDGLSGVTYRALWIWPAALALLLGFAHSARELRG